MPKSSNKKRRSWVFSVRQVEILEIFLHDNKRTYKYWSDWDNGCFIWVHFHHRSSLGFLTVNCICPYMSLCTLGFPPSLSLIWSMPRHFTFTVLHRWHYFSVMLLLLILMAKIIHRIYKNIKDWEIREKHSKKYQRIKFPTVALWRKQRMCPLKKFCTTQPWTGQQRNKI